MKTVLAVHNHSYLQRHELESIRVGNLKIHLITDRGDLFFQPKTRNGEIFIGEVYCDGVNIDSQAELTLYNDRISFSNCSQWVLKVDLNS